VTEIVSWSGESYATVVYMVDTVSILDPIDLPDIISWPSDLDRLDSATLVRRDGKRLIPASQRGAN
jgi:hypothetical protein